MLKIKNIAIIAHVDHGKTTLIDGALRQMGVFRENEQVDERVMDSNDLERERGITIFSKNASLYYKDYKINIVDTPGHADFGGEVQRIMKMVDSVLLLVDAFEGPMPQTKYVLKKSLELGLKPIVVINKIDRPNCRPSEVLDMVFDLFCDLNANDEQLDFPVVYASGRDGWAIKELGQKSDNLIPLMDTILENVPDTEGDREKPLQMLISAIEYNNYLGKIGTGKINNGSVTQGQEVLLMKRDGERLLYRISKIFIYDGLKKKEVKEAFAGDIVSLAGMERVDVGETVCHKEFPDPLPLIEIDAPTLTINFHVNDSPFAGTEGKYVTSGKIRERLEKELQTNVSLAVEDGDSPDNFVVKGRGELQLSILIENMRREGYEFQVSKPKVIYRELDGKKTEPIELVTVDVADEFSGSVIEMLSLRKGEMTNMINGQDGYTRLEFKVPARGLIGFRNEFMTATRGTGIINHSFYEYEYYKGDINKKKRGALIAMEGGTATGYSLYSFAARGIMFIEPGTEVYEGMIIGEHTRDKDLVLNITKGKKLTNVRASSSDDNIKLTPPKIFSLEQALEYIEDDELLEVTPQSMRMRKKILKEIERRRA
ncbi:MAG: translational GTPase TypA [Candidatus Cloacimonadota bacterium]|nr:MAG: translational GTPase TypA [Candidatus Cloacimonadota bacterium]